MRCDKESLLLYAVTDRSWLNGRTLYSQVEEAIKGGATFIQLREKELNEDAFLEEAKEIKDSYTPFFDKDSYIQYVKKITEKKAD